MISAEEFNELPPHLQSQLVLSQGHYLYHRIKGWCKIDLYWFHSYYVEIWFLYDLKSIGLVRALTKYRHLEPYLETIKLKLKSVRKEE